jgi:Flp pilus assembly protein TadB
VVNDRLRIGDAEREAAAHELGEHFAQGRITAEEHAERLEQIMTARTAGDLAPAFRDLPRPRAAQQPPRAATTAPTVRRDRGWDIPRVPFLFKLLLAVVVIWWGLHHFLFLLVAAIVYVVFVRRFIYRRRHPWHGRAGSWSNNRCQTGWH